MKEAGILKQLLLRVRFGMNVYQDEREKKKLDIRQKRPRKELFHGVVAQIAIMMSFQNVNVASELDSRQGNSSSSSSFLIHASSLLSWCSLFSSCWDRVFVFCAVGQSMHRVDNDFSLVTKSPVLGEKTSSDVLVS